ncbi:MAG: hypothetical protein HDT16_11700 [Oscillibacter sp.]|nr:hypothetical protein [Oscillibacter sp.]
MSRLIDLTGQRFGRLTVVSRAENDNGGHATWNCICECGNTTSFSGQELRKGRTKSCGCWKRERMVAMNKKCNEFRVDGNQVIVKLSNTDKEMVTDLDIWDRAKEYCWSLQARGYAMAKIPQMGKTVTFHIFAFPECPDGMVRDHINGNKLDNRRSNIRFVLQRENSKNRGTGKNNASGHIGVSWNKKEKKWTAKITVDGKNIQLGYFQDKEDAIAARKQAEIKYFGEYRRKD